MSAGTLSECMDERFADPLLHTAALQFVTAFFTEEAKCCSEEPTSSNSKHSTTLSDILNGPSASQLCELFVQVSGCVADSQLEFFIFLFFIFCYNIGHSVVWLGMCRRLVDYHCDKYVSQNDNSCLVVDRSLEQRKGCCCQLRSLLLSSFIDPMTVCLSSFWPTTSLCQNSVIQFPSNIDSLLGWINYCLTEFNATRTAKAQTKSGMLHHVHLIVCSRFTWCLLMERFNKFTISVSPFDCWCQSFEKRTLQDPLKRLTARALMALLACSPTAQNHAATGKPPHLKCPSADSCVLVSVCSSALWKTKAVCQPK